MGRTSYGSITTGVVISFVGLLLLAVGGAAFVQYGLADASQEQESYGPFGLFGSREESSAGVSAVGVGGFVMGAAGLLFLLYGLLIVARAFEAGKDREAQTGKL